MNIVYMYTESICIYCTHTYIHANVHLPTDEHDRGIFAVEIE